MDKYFRNRSIILRGIEKKTKRTLLLFYLVSGKLKRKTPDYRGKIEFYIEKNKLRPYKMWIEQNNKQLYLDVRHFKNYMKLVKQIIIISNQKPIFYNELMGLFSDFQIKNVKELHFCRYCLLKENFTVLDNSNTILGFNNEKICIDCATEELILELQASGLGVPNKLKNHIKRILSHKRDIYAILKMLHGNLNVGRDAQYTLYDIIEEAKIREMIKVKDLPIPDTLKQVFFSENITTLTDIQCAAVKNGLLKNESLLIIAATSTGKTMIGELAGIPKALKKQPLVFLVPLVALANQKYDEFSKKYAKLGLKVAIRVGMSRLDVGEEELVIVDTEIKDADIIVGTYEAFDFILRSGNYDALKKVGTIVVDEIQMLKDHDRGIELDGLLSRITKLFPHAQKIYLSATVGNTENLAKMLNVKLVEIWGRPVPLERHLILARDEFQKMRFLYQLIKYEYNHISKYGFPGQTIVFTYSRKRTGELAKALKSRGLSVADYHAGMTYLKRRMVEIKFEKGEYQAVITTAALGAGVDFPASQVVFFDLAMGRDWLTAAEFTQYCGRAGRLGKHDRGKVVLLIIPGNKFYAGQEETEDEIAMKLLSGEIEPVEIPVDFEKIEEQILANISTFREINAKELTDMLMSIKTANIDIQDTLNYLRKNGLITFTKDNFVKITNLGLAASVSFLTPRQVKKIVEDLKKERDVLEIAISLEPFESVYLSSKVHSELVRAFKFTFPTKFFSGAFLDLLVGKYGRTKKLPNWIFDLFAKWSQTFFTCSCKEKPYCEHGLIAFSNLIVNLRMDGNNPAQISNVLFKDFDLQVYPGDVFNWLDSLIHRIEGISRICKVLNFVKQYRDLVELKRNIEKPQKNKQGKRRFNVQKASYKNISKQKR